MICCGAMPVDWFFCTQFCTQVMSKPPGEAGPGAGCGCAWGVGWGVGCAGAGWAGCAGGGWAGCCGGGWGGGFWCPSWTTVHPKARAEENSKRVSRMSVSMSVVLSLVNQHVADTRLKAG